MKSLLERIEELQRSCQRLIGSTADLLPGGRQGEESQSGWLWHSTNVERVLNGRDETLLVAWILNASSILHFAGIVLGKLSTGVKGEVLSFIATKSWRWLNIRTFVLRTRVYIIGWWGLKDHVKDFIVDLVRAVLVLQEGPIDGSAHDATGEDSRGRGPGEARH